MLIGSATLFGQDKKIDNLEVLYSQKHYTKVLRKANKLLAIPDYDYSGMPTFYKSIALFRLAGVPDWFNRHQNGLDNAILAYNKFLSYDKIDIYIKSHYFEVAELKLYLIDLQKSFKHDKQKDNALKLERFINSQLRGISQYGIDKTVLPERTSAVNRKKSKANKELSHKPNTAQAKLSLREKIVAFAKQFLGVKYQWAGTTPNGFDCSGYIGYIFQNHGITMPRSAAAQKNNATKLKLIEAFMGDLVFFKSGTKITHVGLVISKPNEALTMIHSSTSKGIIITNIDQSNYWKPKLGGAGRIIK